MDLTLLPLAVFWNALLYNGIWDRKLRVWPSVISAGTISFFVYLSGPSVAVQIGGAAIGALLGEWINEETR